MIIHFCLTIQEIRQNFQFLQCFKLRQFKYIENYTYLHNVGNQNMPPQNMPLWHKDNFFFQSSFILKKSYWSMVALQCCIALLHSKVNQLHIHPLYSRFPSHLGHHRALSGAPCPVQQALVSYLFYTEQYTQISPILPPSPFPRSVSLLYICVSKDNFK